MKVVAIIAAHNEADVIGPVIGALAAEGVQSYLVDHGSTDGTAEAARAWLGNGLLAVELFPAESGFPPGDAGVYAWEHLLRRKEQLAATLDADWVIHHDADEFRESPWPGLGLADAIERVDRLGYDAIDFAVLEFPPTHDGFRPGDDPREAFTRWEPGAAWDRVQVRCWKKTGRPVDLAGSGGHEACFEGRKVFPLRFLLRHYPVRGQAHGERKVFAERRPRFLDAERARGWHVQYDAIAPGHRFLRDPGELRPWDPDEARLFVALRSRPADEAREQRDRLDAELARVTRDAGNYARDLQAQRAEVERLGQLATALRTEADGLHARLAGLEEERASLHPRLAAAEAEAARLHGELDAARREAAGLHARLGAALAEHERLGVEAAASAARAEGLRAELDRVRAEGDTVRARLEAVLSSRTWRWTAPLRGSL